MMKRTKSIQTNAHQQMLNRLMVLSTLTSRYGLAKQVSVQTFGGDRDIYAALGYPTEILFEEYVGRYERQDIAKAIIDRPADKTWKGDLRINQPNISVETELEKAWIALEKRHKLRLMFRRADKLTNLGKYGVILLGLDDVKTIEDYAKPVTPGTRKLLYLKPLSEGTAKIFNYESNTSSPRYGKPLNYNVTFQESEGGTSQTIQIHYSRVLHIVMDMLESEVEGIPYLLPVYNRLIDLEKIVGGDGEMFWKGARPGYSGKVDKEYQLTADSKADLKEQIDEYEHNLRRILVNDGIDLQALAQQIADPQTHIDAQIQMISTVTQIPKRILTGSERGELSSEQDSDEWKEFIQSRRDNFAEPAIVRPFVDKLMELGILPKVEDYTVTWSDLFAASEKDRATVGKIRAEALASYASQPTAETIVTPDAFMEFFLGLSQEQITLVQQMKDAFMRTEPELTEEEEEIITEE